MNRNNLQLAQCFSFREAEVAQNQNTNMKTKPIFLALAGTLATTVQREVPQKSFATCYPPETRADQLQ